MIGRAWKRGFGALWELAMKFQAEVLQRCIYSIQFEVLRKQSAVLVQIFSPLRARARAASCSLNPPETSMFQGLESKI